MSRVERCDTSRCGRGERVHRLLPLGDRLADEGRRDEIGLAWRRNDDLQIGLRAKPRCKQIDEVDVMRRAAAARASR